MACFAISWLSPFSFLVSLLVCFNIHIALADPIFVDAFCPDTQTNAPTSKYQKNIDQALSSGLSSGTSIYKIFYNISVGNGTDKVYATYSCRVDQTTDFCQRCISLAINSIESRCHGKKEAIVFYDQCLVRYSNESSSGILHVFPMTAWANTSKAVDIQNINRNQTSFEEFLLSTLRDVSLEAVNALGPKFATKEGVFSGNLTNSNTIYTLAECTTDISLSDCNSCLQMSVGNVTGLCQMKADCIVMCPNCNLMYKINPFYGAALVSTISGPSPAPFFTDTPGEVNPGSKHKNTSVIVGITISVALVMVFLLGAWFLVRKRKSRKAFSGPSLVEEEEDEIEIVESLRYDLTTIRKATNNFCADRKLGEGGFGEVYKGLLENGQYVAIKRLSSTSKQGISEFKTEVVLVAKLQHRNLVKFLGFCLSGKEKILVYEFLPNLSLDRFLLDPTRRASLCWSTRFNIIRGIARGLLYLHEDSRLKIVHRDLKPSNILLDEAMNPKIADFGMAKLFGVDQTQDNTDRIVGTFGYMAPEYVIAGHFSTKSDVYGFGIIVLELVSGLKNKRLLQLQNEESLVYQAWTLWNEGIPLKLSDPTLGSDFPVEEMTKCIHIGLLCVQENAAFRPHMASIVAVLNGETITLPSPKPPLFLVGAQNETNNGSSSLSLLSRKTNDDITDLQPR